MVSRYERCPNCLELRRKSSFWEVEKKTYVKKCYCNTCRQEDNQIDAWVERVLKGVYIPHYITPVFKSFNPEVIRGSEC